MALIRCPECGNGVSDKANFCPNCGYPISRQRGQVTELPSAPYTVCPQCGAHNMIGVFTCSYCGHKYKTSEYIVIQPDGEPEFHGIYRYTLFGKKQEVYCPRCHSSNCSYYNEQHIIPAKTKTKYTTNLNPFKPFTLVNKKEKVIRKEKTVSESKIMCNNCGYTFK